MRLFISENPKAAISAKCFVDGIEVSSRCFGADEELGEAHCFVVDDKGMIAQYHTPDCVGTNCTMDTPEGCHLVREVLRGDVRLEVSRSA